MRIRLRFTKVGKVRFTGHRDVARIWERTLRKADLPVAMTEGFSPRPKLHFGLALPTSYESFGEYLDVDLRPEQADEVAVGSLGAHLGELLPPGMMVEGVEVIDRSIPSLQQAVVSCSWWMTVVAAGGQVATVESVTEAVERLLAADEVIVQRERKGKTVTDDLRPQVERVEVVGGGADQGLAVPASVAGELGGPPGIIPSAEVTLEAVLGTQPRAVRPSELLAVIDPQLEERRVVRMNQWMLLDGARQEPVPPCAARAPHAQVRAS